MFLLIQSISQTLFFSCITASFIVKYYIMCRQFILLKKKINKRWFGDEELEEEKHLELCLLCNCLD